MEPTTMAFIASAINFITKYGIQAAQAIIKELADDSELTLEKIDALDGLLRDPESYFKAS